MAVRLNPKGYKHAKNLVLEDRYVFDERGDWRKHQPTAEEQNEFIEAHSIEEYGRWFLGVDDSMDKNTKSYYKFPYSDLTKVHRCAVLAAESRAGRYRYEEIERAAAHLHGMIDGLYLNPFTKPQDY